MLVVSCRYNPEGEQKRGFPWQGVKLDRDVVHTKSRQRSENVNMIWLRQRDTKSM